MLSCQHHRAEGAEDGIVNKKMPNELLSVIVPVYNIQPFVERSIASMVEQTYENLEIILVNDGSTDGSEELCRKYAELDSRVKLISQENQGVTAARKAAVKMASGTYMAFVDGDDYIDKDLLQQMMDHRDSFDLVIAHWMRDSENGTRRCFDKLTPGAYRTQEEMDFILDHMINASLPGGLVNLKSGIASYLWNKLYRADFAKEIYAQISETIRGGEDMVFTYLYLLKCRSVLITDICGYHYRVRSNSIAHSTNRGCEIIRRECDLYDNVAPAFMAHPRRKTLMPQLKLKLSARMARTPVKMGFPLEAQLELKTYLFPFINLLDGKRIALYGAGVVGKHYWRQIHRLDACSVVLWVDEDWRTFQREGLDVTEVEALGGVAFDFLVIAALEEEQAVKIRSELVLQEIPESKIIWRAPLEL